MKNKFLLLVMILVTSLSFSQRNPNQTYLTSFVYEAKQGMNEKFENAAAGALLRKAFDVILAFLFQMLFFQVKSISFTRGFHVAKCLSKGA